uniref:Casc1_N domain-containing protein n=1 Tax=Strongyloides venezuelensis TaxID=75913 RepID=A0A0K0FQB4_STRVS
MNEKGTEYKSEIKVLSEKCINSTATEEEVQRLLFLMEKLIAKAKKTPKIIEDIDFHSDVLNIAPKIAFNLAGDFINAVNFIQSLRLNSLEKDIFEFKEKVLQAFATGSIDQLSDNETPESKKNTAKKKRILTKSRKAEKFKESMRGYIEKFEEEWGDTKICSENNWNEEIGEMFLQVIKDKGNILEIGKKLASQIKISDIQLCIDKKRGKKKSKKCCQHANNDPFFQIATQKFVEGNLDGLLSLNCCRKDKNYIITKECLYEDSKKDDFFKEYIKSKEKFNNRILHNHTYFIQELRKPTISQELYKILDFVPMPDEFLSEEERLEKRKKIKDLKYPDFSDKQLDSDNRPYVYTKMSFVNFDSVPNDWLIEKGVPLDVQQKVSTMFHQNISPIREMHDEVRKYITNEFEFDCTILKVKTTLNDDEINAETLEPMYKSFFDPLADDRLNLNFCNDIDLLENLKGGKICNVYGDDNKKTKQIFKKVSFNVAVTPKNFYTHITIPPLNTNVSQLPLNDNFDYSYDDSHTQNDCNFNKIDFSLDETLRNTQNNNSSITVTKKVVKRKITSSKKSEKVKKSSLTAKEQKRRCNKEKLIGAKDIEVRSLKGFKKTDNQKEKSSCQNDLSKKINRKRRGKKSTLIEKRFKSSISPSKDNLTLSYTTFNPLHTSSPKTDFMEEGFNSECIRNLSLLEKTFSHEVSNILKISIDDDIHSSTFSNSMYIKESPSINHSIGDNQNLIDNNLDDNNGEFIVDNDSNDYDTETIDNENSSDNNVNSNDEIKYLDDYNVNTERSSNNDDEKMINTCTTIGMSQNDDDNPDFVSRISSTIEESPSKLSYAVLCIGTKEQKKKSLALSQSTIQLDDHKIKRCICYLLQLDTLCASHLSDYGNNTLPKEEVIKRLTVISRNFNLDIDNNGKELPKSVKIVNYKEVKFVYELVKCCLDKPYNEHLTYAHYSNMLFHLLTKYQLTIVKKNIPDVNPIPCEMKDYIINYENKI